MSNRKVDKRVKTLEYNDIMYYPERTKICGECIENLNGFCLKNDQEIYEYITLRLATCPLYKW